MALHKALAFANERDQEFATLEHLLLALIDEKDAASVMRACNVDLDRLRADVTDYLDSELANLVSDEGEDAMLKNYLNHCSPQFDETKDIKKVS